MKKRLVFLSCMLLAIQVWAENAVKIFQTNRPAEELLPVVQPLVGSGSVSAFQNKLIVKAPSQNLIDIARALNEIDHAPRNLIIYVSYGDSTNASVQGGGIHSSGIELSNRYATQKTSSDQQIRVLEGEKAFIAVAEQRPQTTVQVGPYGTVTTRNTYQSAGNGFYVRPVLNGDQVRLELSTQNDSFKSSNSTIIQRNQSNTVLTGRLGEWIEVSGTGARNTENESGINYSTREKRYGESHVSLRVELMP
ncbi:MAG TPA: hypothetical protein VFM46_16320 [Pseudomonadales bacterium]|nr:hypothetical protein [Pseudomonadales bacterium]